MAGSPGKNRIMGCVEIGGMMKHLETRYIFVQERGDGTHWFKMETLSFYMRDAIAKLLDGSTMTWKEAKRYGWSWKKVKVELTVIK